MLRGLCSGKREWGEKSSVLRRAQIVVHGCGDNVCAIRFLNLNGMTTPSSSWQLAATNVKVRVAVQK